MAAEPHLVSVWNPAYATDAMEEHLAILLRLATAAGADVLDDPGVYVWWGKVRSPNRQQPQQHLDDIERLASALQRREREWLELYLTDYRSLYVAEVEEIALGDLPPSESAHVPPYYRAGSIACDFWFCVRDLRRLVADDLPAVIAELKHLRNVRYHDRPVSLYGGMVDLPLLVRRDDGRRMFDARERDHATGDRLWAQFDADRSAAGAMERELRDNVLGERVWNGLALAARRCLAMAEKSFREGRSDPTFEFAGSVVGFARALEIQLDALLRRALPQLPPDARLANIAGRTVSLDDFRPLGIGELAYALGSERKLCDGLATQLADPQWARTSLAVVLDAFATVRNAAAHARQVDRKDAIYWRNRLLGIGEEGVMRKLVIR